MPTSKTRKRNGKSVRRRIQKSAFSSITGLRAQWNDPEPQKDEPLANSIQEMEDRFGLTVTHPNPVYGVQARKIWWTIIGKSNAAIQGFVFRRALTWRVTIEAHFFLPDDDWYEERQFVLFCKGDDLSQATTQVLEELLPWGTNFRNAHFDYEILSTNPPTEDHHTFEDGEQKWINKSAA